jgi:hypothetical protein
VRWYKIVITNADTGQEMIPSSLGGLGFTSLLPSGAVNPAALQIELDIPQSLFHLPTGQSLVRIWGLGLQDIGNAFDLNGASISVYAGMSKGLPLANPAQAGLLVSGQILQAFGNWIGTSQTIDLILAPATGSTATPLNFVLNWKSGQTLSEALNTTLSTALPKAKLNINISPRLVQNHDEPGYHGTLSQLASTIFPISKSIITDSTYSGVVIAYDGNTVTVTDQTTPSAVKAIAFQDLLGQPTWIGPAQIQAKLVMRGDLDLQDVVTLPQGLTTTTQQALTRFQDKTTFSGNYVIQEIHHWGNFRQQDADSWNTTVNMYPQPKMS